MQVRNFTLLGAAQLEAVRARAALAVAAWAGQWGVDPALPVVACERAAPHLAGAPWDQCRHAGAGRLWLACPDGMQQAVQQALFGADAALAGRAGAPQLAPLAAERALEALTTALGTALLGQDQARSLAEQPASHHLARGAGTLLVTISIGAADWRCLLDAASVALLAPAAGQAQARAPLAPFNYLKALHATPVSLPVRLGQAELGLSALMSVAVGDVIRLDCAVDAPVEVLGPHGGPLFRAYLGQTQGMVAIDIDGRH